MAAHLSIVIPAFNEAHRLPPTMRRLAEFARERREITWEILIVVEQCGDGTLELAREFAASQADSGVAWVVIDSTPQRGKGHAVRKGMLRAGGELVFYMDADLSVPLAEIDAFRAHFAAHPEIAVLVGNRQHRDSRITRAQAWLRRTMGQGFNAILGRLGLAEFRDTQCGFKAFRRDAARQIFERQQIDGFAFDVEVLLLARKLRLPIADLPVEWINSPESKVHILHDSLRMLYDIIRLRWRLRK
jgi:dolichyl-phosphate beta-glucosyltransferase